MGVRHIHRTLSPNQPMYLRRRSQYTRHTCGTARVAWRVFTHHQRPSAGTISVRQTTMMKRRISCRTTSRGLMLPAHGSREQAGQRAPSARAAPALSPPSQSTTRTALPPPPPLPSAAARRSLPVRLPPPRRRRRAITGAPSWAETGRDGPRRPLAIGGAAGSPARSAAPRRMRPVAIAARGWVPGSTGVRGSEERCVMC